jgi:hypothetical protein
MPAGPIESSGFRRHGYRLLGPRFDYLLHMRPAEWPIMAAHTALGYILAVGWSGIARGEQLGAAILGIAAWVIGLNAGTLAVNSAFDRDDGTSAICAGSSPPHLFRFGLGLMLLGLAAALLLPSHRLAPGVLLSRWRTRRSATPEGRADGLAHQHGRICALTFAGWAATGRLPTRGPAVSGVLPAVCDCIHRHSFTS